MKWATCVAAVAAGLMVGCGGGSNKGPAVVKVSGTVTLDNAPMGGGEVRFALPGQPPKALEIKGGEFSGEVLAGSNKVEVVWDKDGPPNPMDKSLPPIKVNAVDSKYSGPGSPLTAEVPAAGATGLKFEVKSAAKR